MTLPSGTLASRAKANTTARQKLKSKWDKRCKYSADEADALPHNFSIEGAMFESKALDSNGKENWCRLIDEGVVVDNNWFTGEPMVYAVVRKGVLKRWYEKLPKNFVGTIDKDHNRSIDLGKFTKDDLKLVELEDGRYAIDVNVKLDHELYAVKDLVHMGNRTALSVEMFVNADEFAVASKITGDKDDDYLVPLIDELKIEGYAVCLAPKSANSYRDDLLDADATNINFNEDFDMNKKDEALKAADETVDKIDAAAGDPNAEPSDAEPQVIDNTESVETDEKEGVAEPEAEAEADAGDEPAEAETEAETEQKPEDLGAQFEQLKSAITERDAVIAEQKKKIADLEAKLDSKSAEKADFQHKLSDLISLASTSEPTVDESATTPEKTDDTFVNAYKEAFNGLENS